jgi:cell division septal protein FtsQ
MPQKKLSRLSNRLVNKKSIRRNRSRIRKLTVLLIPLSLVVSAICIGLIFILVQITHKPIFISPIALPFSASVSEEDKYISEVEKALQDKKIFYSSVSKFSGAFYKIKLTDSGEVIISSQKDITKEISSLQYILSRLTMEGKQFSRLDLRFDKPVIVLK